jgi:hypothetical protein
MIHVSCITFHVLHFFWGMNDGSIQWGRASLWKGQQLTGLHPLTTFAQDGDVHLEEIALLYCFVYSSIT